MCFPLKKRRERELEAEPETQPAPLPHKSAPSFPQTHPQYWVDVSQKLKDERFERINEFSELGKKCSNLQFDALESNNDDGLRDIAHRRTAILEQMDQIEGEIQKVEKDIVVAEQKYRDTFGKWWMGGLKNYRGSVDAEAWRKV